MRQKIKNNTSFTVNYQALSNTTGLTDLNMHVYDNTGAEISGSPIVMTEVGSGSYKASFTPTATGIWKINIESTTNGDNVFASFDVVTATVEDVKTDTESILSDTATIKADTQTLKDGQTTINNKLDNIDAQISPGGYIF